VILTSRKTSSSTDKFSTESIGNGIFRKKGSTIKNWKTRRYEVFVDGYLHYYDTNTLSKSPYDSNGHVDCNYCQIIDGKSSNLQESGCVDGIAITITSDSLSNGREFEIVFESISDTCNFLLLLAKVTVENNVSEYLNMKKDDEIWKDYLQRSNIMEQLMMLIPTPAQMIGMHQSALSNDPNSIEEVSTQPLEPSDNTSTIEYEQVYAEDNDANHTHHNNFTNKHSPSTSPTVNPSSSTVFPSFQHSTPIPDEETHRNSEEQLPRPSFQRTTAKRGSIYADEVKVPHTDFIHEILSDPQRILVIIWLIFLFWMIIYFSTIRFLYFTVVSAIIIYSMRYLHKKNVESEVA
jgi:hypothetical protein